MKTVVEFKIIKDVDSIYGMKYTLYANKEYITSRSSLRSTIRAIKLHIKGLEVKSKLGLPKVIFTDTYNYDDGR